MSDLNPKDACGRAKPPLRYVPPTLVLAVAPVMELGARKYGPMNWRESSVSLLTYIEAAMRHLMALADGQDNDEESGQPHAAHAAACMGIVLDAASLGRLIDDRFAPGNAPEIITQQQKARSNKPA